MQTNEFMTELKQGSTLKDHKYKIVKVLGKGSFGITYLATTHISIDGQLGNMEVTVNVTVKEFFMADLNSRAVDGISLEQTSSALVKNYQTKFRKEAENLAKLHHPAIVKVLEVFDENNTTYYVMEFIDGETIDEYIKRNGKLSVEESLAITNEVCKALLYMHDHKMLHLDLKPKNIMRNSEGQIFLIDFGLAKQYTEEGEPESSTSLGLGTPGYAPIEQAHYKKDGFFPVTLDIYALGASLFKMLTGKTPPDSSLVFNDGLPLSLLKNAGVNEETIAIVEKAMAPMKKERYQSVKALSLAIGNSYAVEEGTTVQEEEGTVYDEEFIHDDVGQHNNSISDNNIMERDEAENRVKKERTIFKKYVKYLFVVGALLLVFPICWKLYNNYSSRVRAEEESRLYKDALVSKDTLTIQKYLTEFVEASTEHKINVEQRYEELRTADYIDKHMVKIPNGTAPDYGIYYRYVHGDDWIWYKVGTGKGGSVPSFQLFQFEVTNKIWRIIMKDGKPRGDDNKPVNASYEDCLIFIEKLNKLSGKKYRLPTIVEWLSAASPDSGKKIGELGWFRETGHFLHDVGMKSPNEYGLYDMIGNVHEWCQERFDINKSETQVTSTINGKFAAECGGQFDGHINSFPYFSGAEIDATFNCNSVTGFRIARDN